MLSDAVIQKILKHIALHIGDPADAFHELIPQDLHIDIHVVSPSPEHSYSTLVTTGMSERPMTVPDAAKAFRYAELMICLPASWPLASDALESDRYGWPVNWLRLLARAPHEHDTFFASGHTIPNGDPPESFGSGTRMCCMFIRDPVLPAKAFRTLTVGKKTIHFYAMIPIYEDEMAYAVEKGSEALDRLLDERGVTELLDTKRPSVCREK